MRGLLEIVCKEGAESGDGGFMWVAPSQPVPAPFKMTDCKRQQGKSARWRRKESAQSSRCIRHRKNSISSTLPPISNRIYLTPTNSPSTVPWGVSWQLWAMTICVHVHVFASVCLCPVCAYPGREPGTQKECVGQRDTQTGSKSVWDMHWQNEMGRKRQIAELAEIQTLAEKLAQTRPPQSWHLVLIIVPYRLCTKSSAKKR